MNVIELIKDRLSNIHPYNLCVMSDSTEEELVLMSHSCLTFGPKDFGILRCSANWFWLMLDQYFKTDDDIDNFLLGLNWTKGEDTEYVI